MLLLKVFLLAALFVGVVYLLAGWYGLGWPWVKATLAGVLRGLLSLLRKLTPYALFLAFGLAMLAGATYAPLLIAKFYHAVPTSGLAASGAENAAGQQASGWVPSATVASKFITFAGAYILAVLLPWLVQHLTHPGPTRWAKTRYSKAFDALPYVEQFAVYGRLQLVIVIRAAAALVFAALVV